MGPVCLFNFYNKVHQPARKTNSKFIFFYLETSSKRTKEKRPKEKRQSSQEEEVKPQVYHRLHSPSRRWYLGYGQLCKLNYFKKSYQSEKMAKWKRQPD